MATTPSLCPSNFPLLLPVRLERSSSRCPAMSPSCGCASIRTDTSRFPRARSPAHRGATGARITGAGLACGQRRDRAGHGLAAAAPTASAPEAPRGSRACCSRPIGAAASRARAAGHPAAGRAAGTDRHSGDGRPRLSGNPPRHGCCRSLDRGAEVGRDGHPVTGRDIAQPLAVDPNPQAPTTTVAPDVLPVDAGMKWMVDFDEAEAKGMALRITVPAASAAGLDSLLVYGVAASVAGADAKQQPTCSTPTTTTGWSSCASARRPTTPTTPRRLGADDAQHQRSFAIRSRPSATLDPRSNAVRVGTAFRLAGTVEPVLGRIGQTASHELDMRSMNAALWRVGWDITSATWWASTAPAWRPTLAWARDHFVARAAAVRTLLRCGGSPTACFR